MYQQGHIPQVPNQMLFLPSSLLLLRGDGFLKPGPQKMIAKLTLNRGERKKGRKMKKILRLFTVGPSYLQ